jgi:glycosyltransferase involved in cell wall biosynthesis
MNVSVLILTLNEEVNIGDCIDSCGFSDDVVVFDSLSSDRTRAIAAEKGARVVEHAFDNYAAQRNAALAGVSYRHPWVFMVDADERVPPELAAEIEAATAKADPGTVIFHMRRMDFFLGRWLKHSSGYPTWFGRLVRLGRVHYQREFNEEAVADGRIGYLDEHLVHFPFNKGIGYWFERHNRYSSMEARMLIAMKSERLRPAALFDADPAVRRHAVKLLAYRVPLRPLITFLYFYIVRLGILDGRAGFCFIRMRAAYELLIDLKVTEMSRRERGLTV